MTQLFDLPLDPDLDAPPELMTLRGGLQLRVDVVRLLWTMEDRGIRFHIGEDGRLYAQPRGLLTAADVAALKRNLDEVKRAVSYVPPEL